jgi:hypothetical protein
MKTIQINTERLTGATNINCCVPGLLKQGMGSDRNVARQIELNVTGISFTGTSFPFIFDYELHNYMRKGEHI